MAHRVLIPLPDRDFDVTEVAVPWRMLTDAGHDVIFATASGRVPAADPLLLTGVLFGQLGAEEAPRRHYFELLEDARFRQPVPFAALDPLDHDALVLPGGHAAGMRPWLESEQLQHHVATFWRTGRPVGAICHGVLVLARTRDPDTGRSLLHGRRTTCLPRYMERTAWWLTAWKLGRYYRTYPTWVQDEVVAALASPDDFERGPIHLVTRGQRDDHGAAFVVEDGNYVSARWPGDAWLFAERLLARVEAQSSPSSVAAAEATP